MEKKEVIPFDQYSFLTGKFDYSSLSLNSFGMLDSLGHYFW